VQERSGDAPAQLATVQKPSEQVAPLGQTRPQPPQLFGSEELSRQPDTQQTPAPPLASVQPAPRGQATPPLLPPELDPPLDVEPELELPPPVLPEPPVLVELPALVGPPPSGVVDPLQPESAMSEATTANEVVLMQRSRVLRKSSA
jgi:hypothetical protein